MATCPYRLSSTNRASIIYNTSHPSQLADISPFATKSLPGVLSHEMSGISDLPDFPPRLYTYCPLDI
jgi:hypothetical protein